MTSKPSFKRARPASPTNEQMFGWVKELVELTEQFPDFRRFGTEGDAAGRRWLLETLKAQGIKDLVEQTYPVEVRRYKEWRLTAEGEEFDCFFMNGAAFTETKGISGELVYVGGSINPSMDLRDKIVVYDLKSGPAMKGSAIPHIADYAFDPNNKFPGTTVGGTGGPAPSNFPSPYYEAADMGAIGFIGVFAHRASNSNSFYADPTGMVQTRVPGVFLNDTNGRKLKSMLDSANNSVRASMVVVGETEQSTSGNIIAHIQGQKPDAMLVNTHHDAGWSGAVQDASGVAAVLGLAAFYQRFPSNYVQKDLYFVFNGCHYNWNYPFGANKFAEMNPSIMSRVALCIGIEHIGKRFIGENGQLVDTGEIEPRFLWAPRNKMLFDAAKNAIEKNHLHQTIMPKPGTIPVYGEVQSYFLQGIPCFSFMSMPEYLFFAEDTLDKVAVDEFEPVLNTFLDIMDAAMYMPNTWIKTIDR
ncbi:MAG: hypothetical protein ACI9FB_002999 [Candidatus Azotimanducaceae bacterium]|jgi:hypothetical protein